MKPNYRRETMELLENKKLSKRLICQTFDITPATYYNWKSGASSPSEADFLKLKRLSQHGTEFVETLPKGGKSGMKELEQRVRIVELEIENIKLRLIEGKKDSGAGGEGTHGL